MTSPPWIFQDQSEWSFSILVRLTLCQGGFPLHWRMSSSVPGLSSLDASPVLSSLPLLHPPQDVRTTSGQQGGLKPWAAPHLTTPAPLSPNPLLPLLVLGAPSLCPSEDPEVYVYNHGPVHRHKNPITEAPSSKSQKPEPPAACRTEIWWYMRSGRQNGTSQPINTSHADNFHISSKKGKSYTFLPSELFS